MYQRTLRSCIAANGIGVHSGSPVKIWINPAPANTGIVFRRRINGVLKSIPASVDHVIDTRLSTCLGLEDVKIGMVEHLLSAIAGLGIDNLFIDIEDDELPIMDGSAAPYIFLLQSAGIKEQCEAEKVFLVVKKKIQVGNEKQYCSIEPHNGFRVEFKIEFDHPSFNAENQTAIFDFSSTTYLTSLCRARTFGFEKDRELYKKQNLALGSSLDNAVVLSENSIMNDRGLRYYDEFVRHKILDAIGDCYLLGNPIIGHFKGFKSGHTLNNQLLNALLADKDSYELTTNVDVALYQEPDNIVSPQVVSHLQSESIKSQHEVEA